MGLFYTNLVVRGRAQSPLIRFLERARRTAYVSPTIDGVTVIYDRACEDQDITVLRQLAGDVSGQFRCPGLATLVHDDDVFRYWLDDGGALVDAYDPVPGYFDPTAGLLPPVGGDPSVLCRAFLADHAVDSVREILHVKADIGHEQSLLGGDIHSELVKALRLPDLAAGVGYDGLEYARRRGRTAEPRELIHVPRG